LIYFLLSFASNYGKERQNERFLSGGFLNEDLQILGVFSPSDWFVGWAWTGSGAG
jgi:hypothetical protein